MMKMTTTMKTRKLLDGNIGISRVRAKVMDKKQTQKSIILHQNTRISLQGRTALVQYSRFREVLVTVRGRESNQIVID